MEKLVWVCAAGAAGTGLRYGVSLLATKLAGPAFPWGTLIVNVIGCFAIAVVMELSASGTSISPTMKVTLTTGFIGGLTTYSAFNYETLALVEKKAWSLAITNFAVTTLLCGAAGVLGLFVARRLAAS